MARFAISGTITDGNGVIIPSATVTVYPADSTTVVTGLYTAKTGGTVVTTMCI
jgi:hypothetical protein